MMSFAKFFMSIADSVRSSWTSIVSRCWIAIAEEATSLPAPAISFTVAILSAPLNVTALLKSILIKFTTSKRIESDVEACIPSTPELYGPVPHRPKRVSTVSSTNANESSNLSTNTNKSSNDQYINRLSDIDFFGPSTVLFSVESLDYVEDLASPLCSSISDSNIADVREDMGQMQMDTSIESIPPSPTLSTASFTSTSTGYTSPPASPPATSLEFTRISITTSASLQYGDDLDITDYYNRKEFISHVPEVLATNEAKNKIANYTSAIPTIIGKEGTQATKPTDGNVITEITKATKTAAAFQPTPTRIPIPTAADKIRIQKSLSKTYRPSSIHDFPLSHSGADHPASAPTKRLNKLKPLLLPMVLDRVRRESIDLEKKRESWVMEKESMGREKNKRESWIALGLALGRLEAVVGEEDEEGESDEEEEVAVAYGQDEFVGAYAI
ncbi:hypothetical protein JAAARDRAFT_30220 [Jaapia argillacea MUCL 33604]|uniref:Uncharacterized protein n=1 Tax=Jaapia argillacea MUCL 33604 TaxID=933084 RepID=A0A067Q840_9AGAM|nr:hypothetical protein JAAARDRAFT_30220 [Jaapia argillacea MUCL 33604]